MKFNRYIGRRLASALAMLCASPFAAAAEVDRGAIKYDRWTGRTYQHTVEKGYDGWYPLDEDKRPSGGY